MRRTLSAISMIVSGRMAGAALGLVTQVVLAQLLSVAALGSFYMATSLAAVIGVLAACGLPAVTTRFLVRYRSRERTDLSALFMQAARRIVVGAAVLLGGAAALAIAFWPGLAGAERVALVIGCLAGPGLALTRLQGAAATAYRRFNLSYMPDLVVRPVIFLGAVAAMGFATGGLELTAVLAVFLALVIGQAVLQHVMLRGTVPQRAPANRRSTRLAALWLKTALPLTGVMVVTAIFADVAILSAGLFLNRPDVAVFGVVVKVALIVGFIQAATFKILQPDLAEALKARDSARLLRTAGQGTLLAVGTGLAAMAAVAMLGRELLSVFGPEFAGGRDILLALLFGLTVQAAAGPATQMLALTRGQAAAAWSSLIAGLSLLAASALFIPLLGLAGAALAWVITQGLWAALLTVQVRRQGVVCDLSAALGLLPGGVPKSVNP